MNLLLKKLYKSNKNQAIIFIIMSTVNLIMIGVFTRIIVEVNKIRVETAAISRDENLMAYFSMLIVVSLMSILFSLWIIGIISKTIFNVRKEFNIQLRLSGVTRKRLFLLYLMESIRYQIIAVPIGIITMEGAYYGISQMLDISSHVITLEIVLIAVILHILVIVLCLGITLSRIIRFDPIEEMRSPFKTDKIRKLKKADYITGVLGLGMIVAGMVIQEEDNLIITLIPLIGAFLLFDLVLVSSQYLLKLIFQKLNGKALALGQRSLVGYYKKISPIFTTMVVGIMVSIGLMGMFETIRVISRETVQQNIFFEYLIVNSDVKEHRSQEEYEKLIKEIDASAEVAYGINMEMQDEEDITNTVFAIDDQYLKYGEELILSDGSSPEKELNDPEFDGIYLPDYFISDEQVGDTWELEIGGQKIPFKIAGRFLANGSRGRYGFVSKTYLQSVIGMDMVNAFYLHSGSQALIHELQNNKNVISNYVVSKKDIANNSYENAINGVEIFEIAAFMVLIISMLMLTHFYVSSSKQNIFDITRFRAIGLKSGTLKRMYLFQTVSIITQSFLWGSILAYGFIKMGVNIALASIRVTVSPRFPILTLLLIYAVLVIWGMLVVQLTVKKGFKENITKYLTVSE